MTDRFVSRTMRFANLSPEVLERFVVGDEPPAVSWNDLVSTTFLPWQFQSNVFLNDHKAF